MDSSVQVGSYKLLHQIGAGGMGDVWLAEHTMLGRRAAVKLLHATLSDRSDLTARFLNEAKAASTIADPGIVQIFDFGREPDGRAYIVMELLDGEPLDKRLRRRGAFSIAETLRLLRQVAKSLGVAHARGIVHRDLKPENIFIVRDDEVPGGERTKILDFGIAKLTNDSLAERTHTAAVMGTPTYMSPEQCRGAGHVDFRSDIYSLGCIFFTLIAGRVPFEAEGIGEIIAMHLREPPPPLSMYVPGVPAQVEQVVARCLAKDPAQRYASAAALIEAIDSLLNVAPVATMASIPARTPPAQTTLSGASGASLAPPTTTSTQPRPKLPWIVGSVIACAAIVTVAIVAASGSSSPPQTIAEARPDEAKPAEVAAAITTPTPAPPPPVEPSTPTPPDAAAVSATPAPAPPPPSASPQPTPKARPSTSRLATPPTTNETQPSPTPVSTPSTTTTPAPDPAPAPPPATGSAAPPPSTETGSGTAEAGPKQSKWRQMQHDKPSNVIEAEKHAHEAIDAARGGHCQAAKTLAARVRELDQATFTRLGGDVDVARCLQ